MPTSHTAYTVCFSAGESSGDQHAANMFLELRKLNPSISGIGMGGFKMRQSGIEIKFDSSAIGVIGLDVLKHFTEIHAALRFMKHLIVSETPDLLVCVDYKEFNLKLARFAKAHGVKVLFYVSPQVWAWRQGRVRTYGKAIDMMAVIFPFETAYYEAENVPVCYVGHPSVDKVHPQRSKTEDLELFELNPKQPVIGILPGSRANEIKRMLPTMLQAAEKLSARIPGLQFLIVQADTISDEALQTHLEQSPIEVKVVKNQGYDAIQCCDAVMSTSGTASLEIALLEIPLVIAYKLSPLTYLIARLLVKTPFIGLPNIIAGKLIVRELIQHAANPENLSTEIEQLLTNSPYRAACVHGLRRVKTLLGKGGGSKNMADLALGMLEQK